MRTRLRPDPVPGRSWSVDARQLFVLYRPRLFGLCRQVHPDIATVQPVPSAKSAKCGWPCNCAPTASAPRPSAPAKPPPEAILKEDFLDIFRRYIPKSEVDEFLAGLREAEQPAEAVREPILKARKTLNTKPLQVCKLLTTFLLLKIKMKATIVLL